MKSDFQDIVQSNEKLDWVARTLSSSWAGRSEIRFREGKYISFLRNVQNSYRFQRVSYSMDSAGSFPRDRPAGHEDNRSPPSSTEITTECTVPICLLSCTSSWTAEGQLHLNVSLSKGTVGLIEIACLTTGSENLKQQYKIHTKLRFATLLYLFHTGVCGRTCWPQVQRIHSM